MSAVPVPGRQRRSFFLADPADLALRIPTELSDGDKRRRDDVVRALVVLLVSVAVLISLGVVMVFSATSARSIASVALSPERAELFSVATRQAITVGLAGVIGAILALLPYRFVERMCYWWLALGIGLQLAVLVFGVTVNGNQNWLAIGPVQIQPSEFLKTALIVWMAHALARLNSDEVRQARTLLIPAAGFVLSTAVVLLGQDMGTALIYILIGGGLFWIAGMRNAYLFAVGGFGAFGAAILIAAQPSRLRRVNDFFSNFFAIPDVYDPTQAEFAQFAFGSGGLAGVGLGAGKEKWRDLAEAHTDFIFAVIGEEFGFFGALAVIVLFLALGWSLIRLMVSLPTRYGQLVTAGAALWICGQAILNMCVVTGLLPVFGVPLPFLSQGGSSMLGVLAILGVVVGCGLSVPGVKEAFTLRSRSVRLSQAVVKGA